MQQPTASTYEITAFGAIPDGRTMNTEAIQRAIDAAADAGGGTVLVPPGRYLMGTIFLKSYVTLNLAPGSTLLGSQDLADYPETVRRGHRPRPGRHLVIAEGARHVTICGGGIIDGQGRAFWKPEVDEHHWIEAKSVRPSPMIQITDCEDVLVEDIHLTNPAGWTLHLQDSERALVHHVTIDNDLRTPNSDGIDVTGCRDVMISDCYISTCDDAVVLKSSSGPVERVTVTNCVIRTNCAALKLGTGGTYHDMRQVTFSNCAIYESHRGLAIYTVEGGVMEDIVASNIVFDSNVPVILPLPIHIDCRRRSAESKLGKIRNVSISNFIARTQGRILMTCEDGEMLENIALRDIQMVYPYIEDPRPIAADARSTQFSDKSPEARVATAAIVADNIRNLSIDGVQITWPGDDVPDKWQIAVKRENGNFERLHCPTYDDPRPADFHVLWGRHLQGGRLHLPLASASSETANKVDLRNSDITVVN
ncbi:MAG: glycoside hydrolase family 28 protein [Anaerolineae bacterium]